MPERNKIFFISDVHLGLYPANRSVEREKMLVQWLDGIKKEAAELYLLGIFLISGTNIERSFPGGSPGFWANWPKFRIAARKYIFLRATMTYGCMITFLQKSV